MLSFDFSALPFPAAKDQHAFSLSFNADLHDSRWLFKWTVPGEHASDVDFPESAGGCWAGDSEAAFFVFLDRLYGIWQLCTATQAILFHDATANYWFFSVGAARAWINQ